MAEFISPEAFDLPNVEKAVDSTERALLRQDLESIITKVDLKGTPLRKRWSRTKANGLTHEYTQRTSLGSPASSFYADGQLPNDGTTRYLRKGKQIMIEGRIQYREYTDQAGVKKTACDIRCDNFVMLGRMDEGGARPSSGHSDFDEPLPPPPPSSGGNYDDDIPF